MGLKPGEDYSTGADCDCWDINWTPDFVRVTISGMTPCREGVTPPNGAFILPQVAPCWWFLDNDVYSIGYQARWFDGADWISSCIAQENALLGNKFTGVGEPCDLDFTNENTGIEACDAGWDSWGGSAIVNWGPGIP